MPRTFLFYRAHGKKLELIHIICELFLHAFIRNICALLKAPVINTLFILNGNI